jgi:hypothetical protein
MTIEICEGGATARLNSIRLSVSVRDAALELAKWISKERGLVVPIRIPLQRLQPRSASAKSEAEPFEQRARFVRGEIARLLGLDSTETSRLTFTMSAKDAWYLGPRSKLTKRAMLQAVEAAPEKFLELMLQREFIEAAGYEPDQLFVCGGFGPGVYLGNLAQSSEGLLALMEVNYLVRAEYGQIVCNVAERVFARRSGAARAETLPIDAGEGFMLGVTRIVPRDYERVDARSHRRHGINLRKTGFRASVLHYLNVVTEFAERLFARSGVPATVETFCPSALVVDGYLQLASLSNLRRPLVMIASDGEASPHALSALREAGQSLFAKSGAKSFSLSAIEHERWPKRLLKSKNYLVLNGTCAPGEGSVQLHSVRGRASSGGSAASRRRAYEILARGSGTTDPFSELKFRHHIDQPSFSYSFQGLNRSAHDLAQLYTSPESVERSLAEAVRRCFVELSLKEVLLQAKRVPFSAPFRLPKKSPLKFTVVATRRHRIGNRATKSLAAAVTVVVTETHLRVTKVTRTPWSNAASALYDLAEAFPFILDKDGEVRDGRLWIKDDASGDRLTVWSGPFVPKLILNAEYHCIEQALGAQEGYLEAKGRNGAPASFFSKSRQFNLVPHYISAFSPDYQMRGEKAGERIVVQDQDAFVRVFVPPFGGIVGSGDALSSMRDLMVCHEGGEPVAHDLLEHRLVQLYLHTLTHDVLVRGDNSKMSLPEKLVRLALEN